MMGTCVSCSFLQHMHNNILQPHVCTHAFTYSVGDESQKKFLAFSLKPMLSEIERSLPLMAIHSNPADNTHAHCAYASSSRFAPCRSSPCVLYGFTMIISGF